MTVAESSSTPVVSEAADGSSVIAAISKGTTLQDVIPDPKTTELLVSKPLTATQQEADVTKDNLSQPALKEEGTELKNNDKNNMVTSKPHIPSVSASAVLGESLSLPDSIPKCRGVDFQSVLEQQQKLQKDEAENKNNDNSTNGSTALLDQIMNSFCTTGFQATNLGMAVKQIQQMRSWRLSQVPYKEGGINEDESLKCMEKRKRIRARIFLGYTSNQISSGQREVLKFLVQHRMVDVIVTTAGGIEEDIIKCFEPTVLGDFKLSGRELRKQGINRIGNLLVPNKNYCHFEDWFTPILEQMHTEQDDAWNAWALKQKQKQAENTDEDNSTSGNDDGQKFVWTPSKIIHRLGLKINHPESVLYWAAKNDIPVFCPAITDGSIGDMMYFHSYKRPGFVVDIGEDIRRLNDLAVQSHATGMMVLGGGLVKHHICNANLMRNGADFAVFINTGQEFDGSDSGASPDEAISWGKIRITAKPVKVCCDATIAFPLLVSQTFAKSVEQWKDETKDTVCWADDL